MRGRRGRRSSCRRSCSTEGFGADCVAGSVVREVACGVRRAPSRRRLSGFASVRRSSRCDDSPGLAGRAGLDARPFARHERSAGPFMSGLTCSRPRVPSTTRTRVRALRHVEVRGFAPARSRCAARRRTGANPPSRLRLGLATSVDGHNEPTRQLLQVGGDCDNRYIGHVYIAARVT
jgi:hypothetical protein